MDKNGPPFNGYQPPPPGFVPPPPYGDVGHSQMPPQQPPTNVIYMTQPMTFGPETQTMICPHCQASISTRVTNDASTKTHLFALLLCLFACWPCAVCPYCIDSCMVQKHYCPSCNTFLGQYEN